MRTLFVDIARPVDDIDMHTIMRAHFPGTRCFDEGGMSHLYTHIIYNNVL